MNKFKWWPAGNKEIINFRTSGGRLHLLPDVGKIPLVDATLIEEPNDSDKEDESKCISINTRFYESINTNWKFIAVDPDVLSQRTYRSSLSVNETISSGNRDFKILVELKSNASNQRHWIHLVASTVQDKEAWISDISQCIDNIHLHTMMSPTTASIGS